MLSLEFKNILLTTQLCQYLDPFELDLFLEHSKVVSFERGDIIVAQGKIVDGMYIIIEGQAAVTARILGEGMTSLATLKQGDLLGEVSLIEKGSSATSVIADTAMSCLFILAKYFDLLTLFYPETKYKINKAIMEKVSARLKNIHKKITHVMNETDMITRSVFGEVMKSFTKPSVIEFKEAKLEIENLKKIPPFEIFREDEWDELLRDSTLIKTTDQCNLIIEGDKKPSCYIVLRGAVQSSIIQDNKVAKLSVLGPMLFFANISIIDPSASALINYATRERAILLKISGFENFSRDQKVKELWYKFFDIICKSFVILERSANKLDIRLATELYNR